MTDLRRGGPWTVDPRHPGLKHRGGNRWDHVRPPSRLHFCAAQTALIWAFRTGSGHRVEAVLWCACGAVTFPGLDGHWISRNLRRSRRDAMPTWHRALSHLDQLPHKALPKPRFS